MILSDSPAKRFFIIFTRSSGFVVCTEMFIGEMCIFIMRSISRSLSPVSVI